MIETTCHPSAAAIMPGQEFDVQQTHSIERWDRNKLIMQSAGRGWSTLYAAVATVNSWSGILNPVGHYCIGFCLRGPAQLRVRLASQAEAHEATLSPRQFLIIPADEASQWWRRGSSEMLMLYLKKDLIDSNSNCRLRASSMVCTEEATGEGDLHV